MFKLLWMILGLFGIRSPLPPEMLDKVLQVVSQHGLSSILEILKANGLDQVVSSWLANGPNPAISQEDLVNGLGSDKIREMAERAGISPDQFTETLSKALPGLVDKLSPNGTLEEGDWLPKAKDLAPNAGE